MGNDFLKFTINKNNTSQMDALRKIAGGSKVPIGRMVMNGTDLNIFQGDVENFKNSGLGGYDAQQLEIVFGALDSNVDGNLDLDELKAFAALGEDEHNVIDNDKNIIDEEDFSALFDLAEDIVSEELEKDETSIYDDDPAVIVEEATQKTDNGTEFAEDLSGQVVEEATQKTDNGTAAEEDQSLKEEEPATVADRASISDNKASAEATELYEAMDGWGTDEKTVFNILQERGYNSADIVKIMNTYEDQYGKSLMEDIQGDFSGKDETKLREILYSASEQEALNSLGWQTDADIPEDIVQKANEFYSNLNSGDATGYMSNNFDKLSESEKAQVMLAVDILHPNQSGGSAMSRITEGRVWFGREDGYVNGIIKSMTKVANRPEEEDQSLKEEEPATVADRASISDNKASAEATELYEAMDGWGTDEKTVFNILQERGYNSADIVKIMNTYEDQYGKSLMEDIQGDFSGKDETKLREILYSASEQEALNSLGWQTDADIPEDIVQKANEFYSNLNSGDATGYMSNNFDKLSESEKAQVMLAVDILHPNQSGGSAMSRITEGRAWFGREDGYVDNIIKSMTKVANRQV